MEVLNPVLELLGEDWETAEWLLALNGFNHQTHPWQFVPVEKILRFILGCCQE
nr:hypothetical protein [Pseudoxanthomonas winnipegensis]